MSHLSPPKPVMLILPDGESSEVGSEPVFGEPLLQRLVASAKQAGFDSIAVAPGTCSIPSGAVELATGEPIGRPAVVVFESAYISPPLLHRLVQSPLTRDENFSLYDRLGRPTLWITGYLRCVPSTMPICEEQSGPAFYQATVEDLERVLDWKDKKRIEEHVLQDEGVFVSHLSFWQKYIELPLIRFFVNRSHWWLYAYLLAFGSTVSCGLIVLFNTWLSRSLGALLLLVGIQLTTVCATAAKLYGQPKYHHDFVSTYIRSSALRPLGRASLATALSYCLLVEPGRSIFDGLILFGISFLAICCLLIQARTLLHNPKQTKDLVESYIPQPFYISVGTELIVFVLALTGYSLLPWIVLVMRGLLYGWNGFASPARSSSFELQR